MRSLVDDRRLREYEQYMRQPVANTHKPTKAWRTRDIEAGPLRVSTHDLDCDRLRSAGGCTCK